MIKLIMSRMQKVVKYLNFYCRNKGYLKPQCSKIKNWSKTKRKQIKDDIVGQRMIRQLNTIQKMHVFVFTLVTAHA